MRPAAGYDESIKITRTAENFVMNGIDNTLAESCKKMFLPSRCRNGHLMLHPNSLNTLQWQQFDGLSIGYKSEGVVMATVTKASWPVFMGLRIGTSREKVLQVLGEPNERVSDGEDENAEILYWAPGESSAKFVFDEKGFVVEVTWELYYD